MLPVNYSECGATGAADTVDIAVPGIKSGNLLLAVVQWSPGADAVGLAVSDFTVADNKITAGTLDTTGKSLWVMWCEDRTP